ncbi:adenosylcobinamide kinase/adenosylcobinamide phosphate guanyltransferase [Paenibacillus sp. LMG 31456]|uniref:Adenosylcobinamide kinase n=1 Tax=Paenibacillus foliorum TaxID=2654974 RepID=A0A972K477_9BACL|nr:bifunctional adenosylcobinamide kinase/adenosylcobinamide-phosphate guanylyltransferase [Paenibacillus foliorum]NOU95692.1 adenosylcobinamide kinase/adenosylcobinamide phosphate guanyltransferase [Paenibacillus foliorum]
MLVLVTGGARSGKSSFAELYSSRLGQQGKYIATAQAYDEEMRARIGLHQLQRENGGFAWTTVEESYALAETLQELYGNAICERDSDSGLEERYAGGGSSNNEEKLIKADADSLVDAALEDSQKLEHEQPVILVDCLTLWLSNWLLQYEQDSDVEERLQSLLEKLNSVCRQYAADQVRHLVLVTNEVGYGLVPEYKLGRQFRDLSGRMNQQLAREADKVFLVTAGIPIELKSIRYEF